MFVPDWGHIAIKLKFLSCQLLLQYYRHSIDLSEGVMNESEYNEMCDN